MPQLKMQFCIINIFIVKLLFYCSIITWSCALRPLGHLIGCFFQQSVVILLFSDVSVLCSLSAFHLLVVFWLTKQKLLMIWIQPCQRMPHYALMQLQATIIQRQVHVLHCLCIYIHVCIIVKVNIQNEITIWSNSHT